MQYIRVAWRHTDPELPIILYSELDANRFEVRKIDIFSDGHWCYASASESTGDTELGIVEVPPLEEIAADPEFLPIEISQSEFEAIWCYRKNAGLGYPSPNR